MALGGACLPYGGLVRGRYTGKSRVFYLQYALPGAKPPEHIPLQAVHRRLLVGGATYLLGLAGGRASFYLGLRTRSAGGIVARYGDFSSSYFVWLGVLPTFVFYMMLCYNMLDKNYLIVQPEALKVEDMPPNLPALDRKRLERYLREKKPYLDPKLRITDLARRLSTNRSYLSAFIEQGVWHEFLSLDKPLRLMALDRLRVSPANAGKTNMELVLMAGFSGYRNYLRVKKEEDRLALLKVFER